jgi:sugar phosphate isomerase/epimerase
MAARPALRTGLNPYGLTWHLGLQGRGTPRANPNGTGLEGFLALGAELGARVLEIFNPWIEGLSDAGMAALKARLDAMGIVPVISGGLVTAPADALFRSARLLGAATIRFACTDVLCGDRAARPDWADLRAAVERSIRALGRRAADQGVVIAIENHQDFTSAELVEFCGLAPAVGITYDTGNSFPVGEAPLDFTRTVAPFVRHVHLKDYNVQFTPEGFRLVRCAIGDGAVPFAALFDILGRHHADLTAVLEPGALEARHVRLFTPAWWQGYAPRPAPALAACLLAAQANRLADTADFRTPWERGDDGAIEGYELAMIRRSVDNMRAIGLYQE